MIVLQSPQAAIPGALDFDDPLIQDTNSWLLQ